MKKLIVLIIAATLAFTACGKKQDTADYEAETNGEDTSYTQLVSVTYNASFDAGDIIVKFLNSASIQQKIGVEPSDIGAVEIERVTDAEKTLGEGEYNNVLKVKVDIGDKEESEQLFNTFYDKINNSLPNLVKGENVKIEKAER